MARPKAGYKLADGTEVPGTTTIIGRFKDSGGLLHWAFEQGKSAQRGEIGHLYDRRDEAAEAGTLAHDMVENAILGKAPPDMPSDSELQTQARKGFENFERWFKQTRIEIVETEMALVSEEFRFGGTPDAIGRDTDGRLCILDWKTSNGVYQDYLIQLAAYKHLWETNRQEPITGGFHLCRFSKSYGDFAHHYYDDLSEAWEQFVLFRRAYDLDKRLKKRAA